jgi:hypothetical protein
MGWWMITTNFLLSVIAFLALIFFFAGCEFEWADIHSYCELYLFVAGPWPIDTFSTQLEIKWPHPHHPAG